MRLRDLADVDSDFEVTGFAIDHRKVARGSVFGAFKGAVFDGEDFIGEAVGRGAVAVVARPEAEVEGVPHLADAEPPRKLFAELAAKFYAPYPETVVAVTGTNGKTSTVEMTRQMWRMVGPPFGVDRDARRDHLRRPGEDRTDHARHRHLPVQHGRA